MQPRSAETCSALCSARRRGNRCPSRTGRTQEIRPAPAHLQDRRRRRTSLRRGFRESPGHHCGPRSPRSRNRRADSWRVLWFRLDARPDASSKRCHGLEEALCLEVSRDDIAVLLQRKPLAGMDMLAVLGRQFHASQQLVRTRATRNPNEVIEEQATLGERIADSVARFGGSWIFISMFLAILGLYTGINSALSRSAWDPYPFILLNLFLSMLAALQAPVIMMSQNRQDAKDRVRGELDYEVNRRAESEIQGLARKLNLLGDKIGDVEDLLRRKISEGGGDSPSSCR